MYLEVVSQIGGAGQSACCPCSLSVSVNHMTHTGEGGFCYSGLGSLGGGKPRHRKQKGSTLKYRNTSEDCAKVKRLKQSHAFRVNSILTIVHVVIK